MSRENSTQGRGGVQTIGALLPHILPLGWKLGLSYLRFKKRAQRAEKIFRKELNANGLDRETAKKLTENYMNSSHALRTIALSGVRGRWAE
ncbi:MAG: hypothetical protein KAT70_04920 [Thermoplasmata archaeon]|nr:hypothetical protein [Thermoplasmata archaeon]